MLYCTDLRSGRATLSSEAKQALSEYNDIIKETTNYLNNNTGSLSNYVNGIASVNTLENSQDIINAKLIRANEVLKTRYAKLDTCIDSLNAIINILINSVGFDYSLLYTTPKLSTTNEASPAPSIGNTSLQSNPIQENSTTINESSTTTTPNSTPVLDGTCNDNNIVTPQPVDTTSSIENKTTNSIVPNNTTPSTSGDTIINYNYEGNNSSAIVNDGTTTLPLQNEETTTTTATSNKTEVALNGGLIKNNNQEKITNSNAENFIASTNGFSPLKTLEVIEDTNIAATNNQISCPIEKKTANNLPFTPDFSEEEISESERELTPELLPFTSTSPKGTTLELKKQTENLNAVSSIFSFPFTFEESVPIKKLPR